MPVERTNKASRGIFILLSIIFNVEKGHRRMCYHKVSCGYYLALLLVNGHLCKKRVKFSVIPLWGINCCLKGSAIVTYTKRCYWCGGMFNFSSLPFLLPLCRNMSKSVTLEKSNAFTPNVELWCKDATWLIICKTVVATERSYVITVKKGS